MRIDIEDLGAVTVLRPEDRLDIVGYLELGGPKLGRDYSDLCLRDIIVESISHICQHFPTAADLRDRR